jgi:hypothetical protein
LSKGVHAKGLEDGDLGDEEVTLASYPIMHPHPKSTLVGNEFVEQYRESIKPVIEMIEKKFHDRHGAEQSFKSIHLHRMSG